VWGSCQTSPDSNGQKSTTTHRAVELPDCGERLVREAALTAGCDVASYGFALPASAVITGTNAASMHANPNAMIITFDVTRTHKPNKQTIGPKC
jgi:hypothetical protein